MEPDQNYLRWHEGMKVVCVDASHPGIRGWPLVENRIYEIAALFLRDAYYHGRPIGSAPLVELRGVANPGKGVDGFLASRFRPLQKRATDITLFKRLLAEIRVAERA